MPSQAVVLFPRGPLVVATARSVVSTHLRVADLRTP